MLFSSLLHVFILVIVRLTEIELNLELGGLQNLFDVHRVYLLRVKRRMNTRVSIELLLVVEQFVEEGPLWQLFDVHVEDVFPLRAEHPTNFVLDRLNAVEGVRDEISGEIH